MKHITQKALAAAIAAALLSGCGGGYAGTGATPAVQQANLSTVKLAFAVGTALNSDGTTGLNVVSTLRGTNGGSAVLADTPSITGPAGFVVPANFIGAYDMTLGIANSDDGTNSLTGSPQVNRVTAPRGSTFGTFSGVYASGLAPLNTDSQTPIVGQYYPGFLNETPGNGYTRSDYDVSTAMWAQPFGTTAVPQLVFLMGPPAVPFFNDGTSAAPAFAGYLPGFTAFNIPPAVGSYAMNVAVTPSNSAPVTFSANAAIRSAASPFAAVPTLSGVTVTSGLAGGVTGTVTIPTGAVETLVFIRNRGSGNNPANLFFTVEVTGTGAQTFTLPGTLGPCSGVGCSTNPAAQSPTFVSGQAFQAFAVSFDYQALEAEPPANTQQVPSFGLGASGQADLAISARTTGTAQ